MNHWGGRLAGTRSTLLKYSALIYPAFISFIR